MLPERWSVLKLDDVVTKTQLGTTERGTEKKPSSSAIPLIKMGNLGWGSINFKKLEMIDQSYFDESLLLERGDFLFNTRNTPDLVGKSAVWLEDYLATFDNNINRISFKPCIDIYYISYYFNNGRGKSLIQSLPAGSTSVAAIYWKDLKKINLVVPPLFEQRKIAQILSTWDNAISATERLLENSQQRKKALMQQLLTGNKRLPGFEGEWKVVRLSKLLNEEKTRNKNNAINRVLSVTNHSGFVLPEDQFSKRVASENVMNYKVVFKGQYGYNPSRINVGSFARLDDYKEGLLSPMYVVFSVIESKLNNDYFLSWMKSSETRKRIAASTQGTVRDSVGFDSLCNLIFRLPPLIEQQAIANVLTTADQEIDALKKRLGHLKQEKKALMQQLLTGKRRVQVDDAA